MTTKHNSPILLVASSIAAATMSLGGCATESTSPSKRPKAVEKRPEAVENEEVDRSLAVDLRKFGPRYSDFTPEFVTECKAKAESGDPEGKLLYGVALLKGWGGKGWSTPSEEKAGFDLIRKSAESCDPIAEMLMSECFLSGRGCERDRSKGMELLKKAAEKEGGAEAAWMLFLLSGSHHEDVIHFVQSAAVAGLPEAQEYLACEYAVGDVVQKNIIESERLKRSAMATRLVAAENGDIESQVELARNSKEANVDVSFKWAMMAIAGYKKAAGWGDVAACCEVGKLCEEFGVEKGAEQAAQWYAKAAEQGYAEGWLRLGECYMEGKGVPQDRTKALELFEKASEKGNNKATKYLAKNIPGMSDLTCTESVWTSVADTATRITTAPRLEGADAEAGEGILEAFGTRFMPNAYAFYQEKRETAKEREHFLKENFPNGRKSDITGGSMYDKFLKVLTKAISEMDRRHDELCHFYLLFKGGIVTEKQLDILDRKCLSLILPRTTESLMPFHGAVRTTLTSKERTFAEKFLPYALATYDSIFETLADGVAEFNALRADAVKIDAIRADGVLRPFALRLVEIEAVVGSFSRLVEKQMFMHAVGEVSSEHLADLDQRESAGLRNFLNRLPMREYASKWWSEKGREVCLAGAYQGAPLAALEETMLPIPGKGYSLCKYEVTQKLWAQVMSENLKGEDNPVSCVSWVKCQEFLKRLNAELGISLKPYRLPTREEWTYAAGEKNREDEDDWDSWILGDASTKLHPFGGGKANRLGLFDMDGNVQEFSQEFGMPFHGNSSYINRAVGFRLAR